MNQIPVTVARLVSLKGQFVNLRTVRPLKVRKGMPEVLKDSTFNVRMGVEYDNQAGVQERRESGELPAENAGLIGREWVISNFLLKSLKTGKYLMRVTPNHNDNDKRRVRYLCDGVEIPVEKAKEMALASEFADRGEWKGAMDLTVDNIVEVNGKPV